MIARNDLEMKTPMIEFIWELEGYRKALFRHKYRLPRLPIMGRNDRLFQQKHLVPFDLNDSIDGCEGIFWTGTKEKPFLFSDTVDNVMFVEERFGRFLRPGWQLAPGNMLPDRVEVVGTYSREAADAVAFQGTPEEEVHYETRRPQRPDTGTGGAFLTPVDQEHASHWAPEGGGARAVAAAALLDLQQLQGSSESHGSGSLCVT